MENTQLEAAIIKAVEEYIANFDRYDSNPQVRINPATLEVTLVNGSDRLAEVEDSDEAIENAALAHGMANQEAMDYQVTQNPDFYAVKPLLRPHGDTSVPDRRAILAIARHYPPLSKP